MDKIRVPFLSMEITLNCNLSCTICCRPKELIQNSLTSEQIRDILYCASPFVENIVFSGGEPTIDANLSEYLDCVPKGKGVIILTNGTTLADGTIKKEILPRISELRVSIDDSVGQSFSLHRPNSNPKEIFENLITVRREFPLLRIVVTSVISSFLLDHMEEFYFMLTREDLKINALRIIPQVYYKGRAPQAIFAGQWRAINFQKAGKVFGFLVRNYLEGRRNFDLDIQHFFSSVIMEPGYQIETFDIKESPCEYQESLYVTNQGDLVLCPLANYKIANICNFENSKDFIAQRFNHDIVSLHPFKKLKGLDKYQCLLCMFRSLCGFGCPAMSEDICGDAKMADPVRCSFTNIWEREILPIFPRDLQEQFRGSFYQEGTRPAEFPDIVAVLETFKNMQLKEGGGDRGFKKR